MALELTAQMRSALAGVAGFVPYAAKRDPQHYENFPFFELVNLDADGDVDPLSGETAASLLEDFKEHRSEFRAAYPDLAGAYEDWTAALTKATSND